MRGQPAKTAAAFLHRFSAQRLLQSVNARSTFAGGSEAGVEMQVPEDAMTRGVEAKAKAT
jgi:hypothetical protein